MDKTAKRIALKDMVQHQREEGIEVVHRDADIWVVTPYSMDAKKQTRLNAELGISNVNYFGNTNGKPK